MIKRFETFTNNITIINKGIQQLKTEVMKNFNLKGNQGMILFYLRQHPEGLTVSQLSEVIGIDKAASSRSLAELYKNKYIYYPEFSGGKKYNTPAVLTDMGKNIVEQLNKIICDIVDRVSLSNISEEERAIMYRSMRSIAENIEHFQRNKNKLAEAFSNPETGLC